MAKWPPFRRRHFQTHFLEWKFDNFAYISLKFFPKGPINNIPALVQIMAWRRVCDKPLSEPMLTQIQWRIYALVWFKYLFLHQMGQWSYCYVIQNPSHEDGTNMWYHMPKWLAKLHILSLMIGRFVMIQIFQLGYPQKLLACLPSDVAL